VRFIEGEGGDHFREEEDLLFPLVVASLDESPELVERATLDHTTCLNDSSVPVLRGPNLRRIVEVRPVGTTRVALRPAQRLLGCGGGEAGATSPAALGTAVLVRRTSTRGHLRLGGRLGSCLLLVRLDQRARGTSTKQSTAMTMPTMRSSSCMIIQMAPAAARARPAIERTSPSRR
jgi:hypothetical protein